MRAGRAIRRLATGAVVAAAVAALASRGGEPGAEALRVECFNRLRLVRHAVAAYERDHGVLPGIAPEGDTGAPEGRARVAGLVRRQLCEPRDPTGSPSWQGTLEALLPALPTNPLTSSGELVILPSGADALVFAANCAAGWVYLVRDGIDEEGFLPAGVVLPCGGVAGGVPGDDRSAAVRRVSLEVEDFRRWR